VWRLNEIREMLELRRQIDELDRASYQEQHAGRFYRVVSFFDTLDKLSIQHKDMQ